MERRLLGGVALTAAALTLVACGGSDEAAGPRPAADLDSIVALGHSGTTGVGSDPDNPIGDARQNSWATGTNPEVDSVYQRLLATHPALKGHTESLGEDGSTVAALDAQVDAMKDLEPVPDVVLLQTFDNDIHCDGTDAANQRPFGRALDEVLTRIEQVAPNAQVFIVSQWGEVASWAEAARTRAGALMGSTGTGLCDLFTPKARVRGQAVRALQGIVDTYFATAQQVCDRHESCFTDGGHLRDMPVHPDYLTEDGNHLSVKGHAVMAEYAWEALPDEIKDRP